MIRAITPADKAQWARLFVAYGIFYEMAFTREIVDAVVAVQDATITGFALYRELYDTFTAGPAWHLDDLYVDPAFRGSGTATDLIEAVSIIARENGGGTVRWITAADNTTAQRVYDRVATRKTWVTYEKEN